MARGREAEVEVAFELVREGPGGSIALDAQDHPHIALPLVEAGVARYTRFDGAQWASEDVLDSSDIPAGTRLTLTEASGTSTIQGVLHVRNEGDDKSPPTRIALYRSDDATLDEGDRTDDAIAGALGP